MTPIEQLLAAQLEPMFAAFNGAWSSDRQVRLGRYVVDFLIRRGDEISIAIECDGHTYHDRTDEQATHDRKRDRWLLRNGIVTVRFSSSEIFANAEACATELIRTAVALLTQRRNERDAAWERGFWKDRDEVHPEESW